jgi:hypothetical protein
MRFLCEDVHAHDSVLAGNALLARAAERIEPLADLDAAKADLAEHRNELSLRESAGNSTRPEVDVLADPLGELARDYDVRVQESPTRFQDAEDLSVRD